MSIRDGFEKAKTHLEARREKRGREGCNARAILALLPVMIDYLESEERRDSNPSDVFDAIGNAFGNMIGQAVVSTVTNLDRINRLDEMLMQIRSGVLAQLQARRAANPLILPERFSA